MFVRFALSFSFVFVAAFAQPLQIPWLTGPLIAPVGTAVPYGNFVIKSYIYCTVNKGPFNEDWEFIAPEGNFTSVNAQFPCYFGLTPWCDLNVIPQFFYNTTASQHSVYLGDLTVGLDFQLMSADLTLYFPGIKFAIREVFPTGTFQFLHPRKLYTDLTGAGTFATQFDLIFYKLFHLYDLHWLSTTFSAQCTVNTPIHVHGFNAYGGGFGTNGMALVGSRFQGIASFEFTLNKNWALALDTVYVYKDATQFYGMSGISFAGTFARVGDTFSEQLQLAPAIEYNFSRNLGLIAGCWFSIWERNCQEFCSGVMNFAYVY